MTGSRQPQLNEELLSAYLDNEVTVEERALVEAAIAADPAVAWQVESLRQTVQLLQALPPLALPRSFTLNAAATDLQAVKGVTVAQAEPVQSRVANKRTVARPTTEPQQSDWWQWFLQLWQGGNLQLRNAAMVAFTLLIVLVASNRFVAPTQLRQPAAMPVPVAKMVTTDDSAVTASAAIEMTTAPMETATTVAEATPATPATVLAYSVTEAPAPNAKMAPGNPATGLSTAKLPPPPSGPGEDTFDMSGGPQGNLGDQPGESMTAASVAESRIQATVSGAATALTESVQSSVANGVSSTSSLTATVAPTVTITATVTATATATVTMTASISGVGQTGITNTEVLTVSSVTSDGAQAAPGVATESWLTWAELMVGVCTVVLGGLWWRSRGGIHA